MGRGRFREISEQRELLAPWAGSRGRTQIGPYVHTTALYCSDSLSQVTTVTIHIP